MESIISVSVPADRSLKDLGESKGGAQNISLV